MKKALIVPVVALLAWIGGAFVLDVYGAEHAVDGSWDLIIVAGCRVNPDGTPSLALQRRVDRAMDIYEQGAAPQMLFTGGKGDFGGTEAEAAASYARTQGLPAAAILLEDESHSTDENARFSSERYPAHRVLVVSDSYHIFRVERVFGRYYPDVRGVGSTPRPWWRFRGSMREVLAVGWYGVTGRL